MNHGFGGLVTTEIIIYAPPYDPNSGGAVVLHKLCDTLNKTGHCRAVLLPYLGWSERYVALITKKKNGALARAKGWRRLRDICVRPLLKWVLKKKIRQFQTNPAFSTPVIDGDAFDQPDPFSGKIIIYSEIINGNPLQARRVARWLLHNPGFHTGKIHFGLDEIHFRFSHETIPAVVPGLRVSDLYLTILHIPWEYYNMDNVPVDRPFIAYSLRKGAHKSLIHDVEGSILIDDKPHDQVAAIFKKSHLFLSYDSRSAYSQFASLCGCDSVIVPDPGVAEDAFFKSPESRFGVSYGFDGVEAARGSRQLLAQQLKRLETDNLNKALAFLEQVDLFFSPLGAEEHRSGS